MQVCSEFGKLAYKGSLLVITVFLHRHIAVVVCLLLFSLFYYYFVVIIK